MERRALLPKGELYCAKESSIGHRRDLLQKGEVYCKEESSIVEHSIAENIQHTTYRPFLDSMLISMKTRKLCFHHYDTTFYVCSVFPKIEELVIPIGF